MKLKVPGHEIKIDKDDKEFLSKITKTDLVGLLGGDWIKYWRWNNLLKIVRRVRQKAEENSLEPKEVAPKFLQQFFEASSLEQDENLQDMWANLLLNESIGKKTNIYYLSILKELEIQEVKLLQVLYSTQNSNDDMEFDGDKVKKHIELSDGDFETSIDKLYGFRLLKPGKMTGISSGGESPALDTTRIFKLTKMGLDFCKKCNGIDV